MRVTGESITDAQIRKLRERTGWKGRAAADQQRIATALSTPKWPTFDAQARAEARAWCAEKHNAWEESIPNVFDDLFPKKER